MSYKIYQVGGSVRDELMGEPVKDYDFVFCLDDIKNKTVEEGWNEMLQYIHSQDYTVFLVNENALTVRAKFPSNHKYNKIVADFVLARHDLSYNRGVDRSPNVVLGTLYDDLIRRDFTVNAIAKDENGKLYDPFNGQEHIKDKILVTPKNSLDTLLDDPLRALRAIRFFVTKKFKMSNDLINAIFNPKLAEYFNVVSKDRIREELNKTLSVDTPTTFITLEAIRNNNPKLFEVIFKELNLKLTNRE